MTRCESADEVHQTGLWSEYNREHLCVALFRGRPKLQGKQYMLRYNCNMLCHNKSHFEREDFTRQMRIVFGHCCMSWNQKPDPPIGYIKQQTFQRSCAKNSTLLHKKVSVLEVNSRPQHKNNISCARKRCFPTTYGWKRLVGSSG